MKRFRLLKNGEIKAEGVEFTLHLYVLNWLSDNSIDVISSLVSFSELYTVLWIDSEEEEIG